MHFIRTVILKPSKAVLCILLFFSATAAGQTKLKEIHIQLLTETKSSSFRGMSVVNDSVLWVCGSNGYIGRSKDAGKTWSWMQIPHTDKLDFRSIKAFSAQKAIVVNAGSPAYIFMTTDGGKHWKKVYENNDKQIFLDGITFWNKKRGLVYGDPMAGRPAYRSFGVGRFVLLSTKDGGAHWKMKTVRNRPKARHGEASFAASGTAIFSLPPRHVWIGTGGQASRILFSKNHGKKWTAFTPPVIRGKSTTGIFSLAFWDKDHGICVGGDYNADSVRLNNAFLTNDGGQSWIRPVINPFGYRSCVIYLNPQVLIATGTSGTDISFDGGMTWKKLSPTGFHVVQKARNGSAVYLAGSEGRIARLEMQLQ